MSRISINHDSLSTPDTHNRKSTSFNVSINRTTSIYQKKKNEINIERLKPYDLHIICAHNET